MKTLILRQDLSSHNTAVQGDSSSGKQMLSELSYHRKMIHATQKSREYEGLHSLLLVCQNQPYAGLDFWIYLLRELQSSGKDTLSPLKKTMNQPTNQNTTKKPHQTNGTNKPTPKPNKQNPQPKQNQKMKQANKNSLGFYCLSNCFVALHEIGEKIRQMTVSL